MRNYLIIIPNNSTGNTTNIGKLVLCGKATASQIQYLSASIELQQTLLTSCDSIIANQLNWLEKYVKENNASNFFVEPFLRIYASIVELCMSCISISYDSGTLNTQSYTKTLDTLNKHNLKIKYVKENNASNFFVEPFLRIYASIMELCMSCISISYDSGTLNTQSYTKTLDTLNKHN